MMAEARRVGVFVALQPEVRAVLEAADVTIVEPAGVDEASVTALLARVDAVINPPRLSREQIESSPGLRAIARFAAGVDNIDLAAATRRGIPVVNGSGLGARAVAEYIVAAMVFGRIAAPQHEFRGGTYRWTSRMDDFGRRQLSGTTFGLVGLGRIGQEAAAMAAAAYDVVPVAFDPFLVARPDGIELMTDLDELLARSDTVSLSLPLSDASRGLLGRPQLDLIGPSGLLINTSRGGIVDEPALIEALRAHTLGGAVIDVFEGEPDVPTPAGPPRTAVDALAAMPNVIVTPHIAGVADQALRALHLGVAERLVAILKGERITEIANPGVYAETGR
jgi:D-3-phosphoglycerate dehydrogenase / 2-oxoglutarate reductase